MKRRPKKLDGSGEAHLIALACSTPPERRVSWTLQLLAAGCWLGGAGDGREHQRGYSGQDLEKNQLRPWLKECWCIPPKGNAQFVCAMENVLEVYHRDYEEGEVLVCLDQTSKQLVGETRHPQPTRPGSPMTCDYEYQRNGVSNLFMLFAPLEGWRRVEVTQRHTRKDWVEVVRKLVDQDFPHKERIVLVMDNFNTHHLSSLYEPFEPEEALPIAQRLEIHHTPKHGSWLNIACPSGGWGRR